MSHRAQCFGHCFVQAHRIDIGAVALSRLFGA